MDRLISDLKKNGQPEKTKGGKNVYALATSILQKNGYMKKGSRKLTAKGLKKQSEKK